MADRRLQTVAALAGCVLLPALALGASPPDRVPGGTHVTATPVNTSETHLRFEAYWGGFHMADFVLSLRNSFNHGGKAYDNAFRLETRGLADLFLRLRIKADTRGEAVTGLPVDVTGAYRPSQYRVEYTNRRRQRSVRVAFKNGHAQPTIRTNGATAEEDREKEGKVSEKFRAGVMDPLTALAEIFRRTGAHIRGGPAAFRLAVYDGRRRFDLEGEFRGRVTRTILGRSHDVYRVHVQARPIAGFKDSHRKLWNDQAYDIYFSDSLSPGGALTPIQFMSTGNGPVMNLLEVCPGPCRLAEN